MCICLFKKTYNKMSRIDMRPPQTYSRLFRPWDSSKALSKDNIQTSENISDIKENYEELLKPTNPMEFNHNHLPPYPLDNSSLGLTSGINDLYFNSNVLSTPPANAVFNFDQITISLMEQEYARVMAEDAHIKALNARKQRPKKFKCPHCDVAFSNNGQLKGHIRIHTGERPFKCDVESCGKTFTRNEELTRHKRIHTGLRPFGCSSCGKSFGRRDHLKKHMKTHMPQERQLGPAIFVPMYPYLYGY